MIKTREEQLTDRKKKIMMDNGDNREQKREKETPNRVECRLKREKSPREVIAKG